MISKIKEETIENKAKNYRLKQSLFRFQWYFCDVILNAFGQILLTVLFVVGPYKLLNTIDHLIILKMVNSYGFCDNVIQDLIHILRKQIKCLVFNSHVFQQSNYCNRTRTHNHLVCKRTLNHLAKLKSVHSETRTWHDNSIKSD